MVTANETQTAELQRMIDRINELDQEDRTRFKALADTILETMLNRDKYFKRSLTLIKGGE